MPPTKPTATQRTASLRFRLAGVDYLYEHGRNTGEIELGLWKGAGITPAEAIEALTKGSTFGLAAVVYLARRQGGENIPYSVVSKHIDGLYAEAAGNLFAEIEVADEEGGPDPFEHPETNSEQ